MILGSSWMSFTMSEIFHDAFTACILGCTFIGNGVSNSDWTVVSSRILVGSYTAPIGRRLWDDAAVGAGWVIVGG